MSPISAMNIYQRVDSLRNETFALVDELLRASNTDARSTHSTMVVMHMQEVANKLGAIESLLGPSRAVA